MWIERLLRIRRELVGDTQLLAEEGLKPLDHGGNADHLADHGSESFELDLTLSLIERGAHTVQDIDDAIQRLKDETFGLCEDCEKPIPAARLKVLPHARCCIACQTERERS